MKPITLQESGLIKSFMALKLTEPESRIAVLGSGGQNPANNEVQRTLDVYEDGLQREREIVQGFQRGAGHKSAEQRLKDLFTLFLTPAEAEIAAAANGVNPANNGGKQNDREFFQDILQPIGRNG